LSDRHETSDTFYAIRGNPSDVDFNNNNNNNNNMADVNVEILGYF
jgi:hypothetical protein